MRSHTMFEDDYRDWQNDLDSIMEETEGEIECGFYPEELDELID